MPGRFLFGALVGIIAAATAASPVPDLATIQSRLRLRFEEAPAQSVRTIGGESVHSGPALDRFYAERLYRPAWLTGSPPRLSGTANDALASLQAADRQGLVPMDYHVDVIQRLLTDLPTASDPTATLADLELALSDGLLTYADHMAMGRVDPAACDAQWITAGKEIDLAQWLTDLAATGDFQAALERVTPKHDGHRRLVEALAAYRRIVATGGWTPIDAGPTIQAGDEGPRVEQLRSRLATSGYPTSTSQQPDLFGPALDAALRRFQERHGLAPDGRLGPETLEELNVPAEARVRQIELNLERWRWLPLDLGRRYVVVNIPAFELRVQQDGNTVMRLKVVVGKTYHETPVFSGQLRYMVLNPYWEIPDGIAVREELPAIKKDPGYLEKEKIRVLRNWGAEEEEVDPRTVDWAALGAGRFPYRLRQDPGSQNALGRIKFMFPNPFDVYLHDTPAKGLFAQNRRDFSHGCIRVERPLDLAEYLMSGTKWSLQALQAEIESGRQTVVPLPQLVPIYVEYWTAWAEPDGRVQFRRDLYGRDATLDRAMRLACSP